MLTNAIVADTAVDFAADIRAGLTKAGQKELPSKYLYDTLGSKLFEVIAELPEYGLTRADERLLRAHAHEIVRRIPGDVILCELGSGSGTKTRWILEALSRRRYTSYFPIEISPAALAVCRRELADILPLESSALSANTWMGFWRWPPGGGKASASWCCSWAAPSATSAHPADVTFLRDIRTILQPGDALLLGTDLRKADSSTHRRLRRSLGSHGRIQPESAGPHQSRAGGRLRSQPV